MKLNHSHCIAKIKSQWTKALNIRPTTVKLLGEKQLNLHDFEIGKDFINLTPKVQATEKN